MKLSAAQRRHLVELYGDGSQTLYWKMTHGDPEHRSALALQRLGLVREEGSILTHSGGYVLTERGREVAAELVGARRMRAISLTQPWATLVAIGAKKIETRSWTTSYRGPLAIHAAKGLGPVGGMRGLYELVGTEPFLSALRETPHVANIGGEIVAACATMPRGRIVAVCRLVDVVVTGEAWSVEPDERERAFGDFSPGRYAWILDDVIPLAHPIEARGMLQLWTPEEHVDAYLRGLLVAAERAAGGLPKVTLPDGWDVEIIS